jgi:hypothetical protein
MNKNLSWLLVPGFTAIFSLSVAAIDMPTPEFQSIMKSNAGIVDLVGGGGNGLGRDTNIDVKDVVGEPSLRVHLREKNFDAIVKDAATLKDNFAKIEAFWTARKADDAVTLSKTAVRQIGELEAAARQQDVAGVTKAQVALANTCRDCHLAHRTVMLTDRAFAIR